MAPFSVAQLKERASNVKDASTERFQSVRQKYASSSSAQSSYDHRDQSTKAPPPPSRTSQEASQEPGVLGAHKRPGPPPPIRRTTRPDGGLRSDVQTKGGSSPDAFRWSNISNDDKSVLFSWLDEFFDARGQHVQSSNQILNQVMDNKHAGRLAKKDIQYSRPPHVKRDSSAQNLGNFFSTTTRWDASWYSSEDAIPPPLKTRTDCMRMHTMRWSGNTRTLSGGVLFSDLSACWYTVTWDDRNAHDPSQALRTTKLTPKPDALSSEELVSAHETYGETVAGFAEGYEGTGQWCARGECWDLANEALKAFEQWDYVPKPLPSIGTTHGHLIYEGNAWGNDSAEQTGRWRGGDDRIRRGDIVQWKSVKIVDGNRWFTLGDPDHTAVIVRDQQPTKRPLDGEDLRPADLGSLEVVEQSVHSPPARQIYMLGGMVSGAVWIYRPVGMEAYLKFTFDATYQKST